MTGTQKWTAADAPDQRGRVAVITGANSGIGFEAAAVLAVREVGKGEQDATRIRASHPEADVTVQELGLASLASVRVAAQDLRRGIRGSVS